MRVGSLEFEQALDACRAILRDVARHDNDDPEGFITYGELTVRLREQGYAVAAHEGVMPHLLGATSRAEDAEGRGMLSALVVQADTHMPGRGFFNLARSSPFRRSGDDAELWMRELQRLRQEHAPRR